jgi:hypothetical protein
MQASIDEVSADLLPEDKVDAMESLLAFFIQLSHFLQSVLACSGPQRVAAWDRNDGRDFHRWPPRAPVSPVSRRVAILASFAGTLRLSPRLPRRVAA